jgi:glycosyltransferase involved in cell wall biosynthesis
MRVLHVIPSIAERYGGPSRAVRGMCGALRARGVDAVVATTGADGPAELDVEYGNVIDFNGTRAILFRRQWSESFKWSPALSQWLGQHASEFQLVHVHAVFSHSALAAGASCRAHGVPYVVRPLGTLDPWSLDRHRVRKQLLMALGARQLLAGAAAMHYTSSDEQALAEGRLQWLPPGVVVSLGIDDECFASEEEVERPRDRIVLSIGRLHPKKRVERVIDGFHAMAAGASLDGWQLVIAGDGDRNYVSGLRRAAESGPAGSSIAFTGWVSGERRLDLLRRAQLVVAPSHQENFGLAVVEAMAAGVPAIVTPGVNLARDIDAAGAGWVSGEEPEALLELLRSVLSNPDELQSRGRRARDFATRYRWTRVAADLTAFYERVLSRSPLPDVAALDPMGTPAP